jgi:hypothetical protein
MIRGWKRSQEGHRLTSRRSLCQRAVAPTTMELGALGDEIREVDEQLKRAFRKAIVVQTFVAGYDSGRARLG